MLRELCREFLGVPTDFSRADAAELVELERARWAHATPPPALFASIREPSRFTWHRMPDGALAARYKADLGTARNSPESNLMDVVDGAIRLGYDARLVADGRGSYAYIDIAASAPVSTDRCSRLGLVEDITVELTESELEAERMVARRVA